MLAIMATKEKSPQEGDALGNLIFKKYGDGGQVTFARNAGIHPSTVTMWIQEPVFKRARWRSVKEAMEANGMDPKAIREDPVVMLREKAAQFEELWPAVEGWSADHLRSLKRILEASPASRDHLLTWIKGRLSR